MSAPLVVNTADGAVWTRRDGSRDGEALYAPEKCGTCPQFVMVTLTELAELGISGSADALPVPVVPEPLFPQGLERDRQWAAARERADLLAGFERALAPFCGDPKAAAAAVVAVRDVEFGFVLGEADRLSARVAELEALTPAAIQTCRKCGAGYTYGEPCSSCAFKARMAAELQARGLDGEHYPFAHHDYRVGHDLPETGGAGRG